MRAPGMIAEGMLCHALARTVFGRRVVVKSAASHGSFILGEVLLSWVGDCKLSGRAVLFYPCCRRAALQLLYYRPWSSGMLIIFFLGLLFTC